MRSHVSLPSPLRAFDGPGAPYFTYARAATTKTGLSLYGRSHRNTAKNSAYSRQFAAFLPTLWFAVPGATQRFVILDWCPAAGSVVTSVDITNPLALPLPRRESRERTSSFVSWLYRPGHRYRNYNVDDQ